ncbi:MAG TPA: DUF4838 domain-containing protein [Planctomycetota bacterium]|nr:DUF4838 domain-containing protein [Planctomycetota bacterium]
MLLLSLILLQGAPVDLARGKEARQPVVVGKDASPALRATAAELAGLLGRMSGAAFKVEPGDGRSGIVLGRPGDFAALPFRVEFGGGPLDREDYLLRSTGEGLYLLGATELGATHAAWDLLHRLGYRQFFPGETWEVVPPPRDLSLAVDVRERPSFHARRIWYNWGLWGYNDEPYRQWCARNRMAKGFDLNSGHAYEAVIAANKAAFDAHPEYYALVGGKRRTSGGDLKLCISNPGLRKLVAEHAARTIGDRDSVSMDPSDGDHWCECDPCVGMGSISNRVLTLANEVARAVAPKHVGTYAYNRHSAPPTIQAEPNVVVSATTAFIGGGFTFDQVVEGWKARGATLGVYDYLSVVDWDWNLPRGAKASRPSAVAASLARFHAQGARFYDAESGDCWGPCGPGYYVASRVLWDVREAARVDAHVADFLEKAFGPAREPMAEFYRLTTEDRQRRPSSDLLGRMYRQLDAARTAAADPAVRRRLDDLLLYTRYAELYHAHAAGKESKETVARHAYRMRRTMMVHSYGLWARLLSQRDAHADGHPLKDDRPFTPDELDRILAEGIRNNAPVDPGFVGVEYSRTLVPAAGRLKLPDVAAGRFPSAPQDRQQFFVWMDPPGPLELTVTVKKVWANRMPKLSLYSPKEVSLNAVAEDANYVPDGKPYAITLKTPHAGLHRVEAVDGGDHTRIDWPSGLPVTIESGIDSPHVTSQFRGPWTLHFYVPKGTTVIGGWSSRIANWAPRASGKLLGPDGRVAFDFGAVEEGWFKVPVPQGQDGTLWTFADSQGQRLLMTVPPYLARTGRELLLPAEVVEADGGR